jgi:hypothetical protein
VENLLNFCWLLLALAALAAWLRLAAHRRRAGLGLIALLCILALMFPVISATDDLHPAAQAIEDSSRRTQRGLSAIHWFATHINHGIAPAPLVAPALAVQPVIVWLVQPASAAATQPGFRQLHFGRSPPVRLS